jgi:Protein of unknown function (DUF2924)
MEVSMGRPSSPNRGRKPASVPGGSEDLTLEVAQLPALDLPALQRKWVTLFGADPSPHLGRQFMIRALAYRLQEKALGGLKPSTLKILDRVVDGAASAESERALTRRASAGTVLIRQWHGVSHRVTVLDHEVVYRGRRYQSLSEVARVITGTHWSGPVFFGLKNRAKEAANG